MRLNQLVARGLYSLIVGVLVMLAVPVSQLRLVSIRVECCCPDPDHCKCPDHRKSQVDDTKIEPCHKSRDVIASGTTDTFPVPEITVIDAPAVEVASVELPTSEPHEPPSPKRPRGPS